MGSIRIRQTLKMPAIDLADDALHSLMKGIGRSAVPPHAGTSRHQRSIGLKRGKLGNLIVRSLRKPYHSIQRKDDILIARSLSAPWTSIYIHCPIDDSDHRIVIIKEPGTFYIL